MNNSVLLCLYPLIFFFTHEIILSILFFSGFLSWKKKLTFHFDTVTFRVSKIFHYFHFRLLTSYLTCLFFFVVVVVVFWYRLFPAIPFFNSNFPESWTWNILTMPNSKQHLIIFLWKLSFLPGHFCSILVISAWKYSRHPGVGTNYKNRFV